MHLVNQSLILTTVNDALERNLTINETVLITLPRETLNTIKEGSDIGIVFTVYRESTLFPLSEDSEANQSNTSDTTIGSYVVSAIVNGIKAGAMLSTPVQFSLRLTNLPPIMNDSNTTKRTVSCVFWDLAGAGELN